MARSTRLLTAALFAAMLSLVACGDDNNQASEQQPETAAARGADLAAIKGYLLEHTERLVTDTAEIRAGADEYFVLAQAANFDYERLLEENREEVRELVEEAQTGFVRPTRATRRWRAWWRGCPRWPSTT